MSLGPIAAGAATGLTVLGTNAFKGATALGQTAIDYAPTVGKAAAQLTPAGPLVNAATAPNAAQIGQDITSLGGASSTAPPSAPLDMSGFKTSPLQKAWSIASLPLMASPETARLVQGVNGMVELFQNDAALPQIQQSFIDLANHKITPQEFVTQTSKVTSLKTLGDYLTINKSAYDIYDAEAKSRKTLNEAIKSAATLHADILKENVSAAKELESVGISTGVTKPSTSEQAFRQRFPMAQNPNDYKDWNSIYEPIARAKQSPVMAILNPELANVDPLQEADRLYAAKIGLAQPNTNRRIPQGSGIGQPTPQPQNDRANAVVIWKQTGQIPQEMQHLFSFAELQYMNKGKK